MDSCVRSSREGGTGSARQGLGLRLDGIQADDLKVRHIDILQ
jgi:hypothetical protein